MSFLIHSLRSGRDSDAADFAKDIPTVLKAAESSVKVGFALHRYCLLIYRIQGLSAEVEILAKDLLKIDRSAKKMKEVVGVVSDRDEFFYSEVERFVSQYVT